jgi:amino-acid N-acetyltransferase
MMPAALSSVPAAPRCSPPRVRAAVRDDLDALYALLRFYSDQGILLPRTKRELRKIMSDFLVISSGKQILACGVLHPYTPKIAELRSLAVAPGRQRGGLGRRIVEALLAEARRRGLDMVFAFTNAPAFFLRVGFTLIDRSLVPWKAWKDCQYCPKRACCDEIAVAYWIRPQNRVQAIEPFPILRHPG